MAYLIDRFRNMPKNVDFRPPFQKWRPHRPKDSILVKKNLEFVFSDQFRLRNYHAFSRFREKVIYVAPLMTVLKNIPSLNFSLHLAVKMTSNGLAVYDGEYLPSKS